MQYIATILALLVSFTTAAQDNKFVALNIQPGLWVYQTEMDDSKMMEAALASVPEAQRAMVKEMMQGKMQVNKPVQQCITAEQIKNPKKSHFEQATKGTEGMDNCEMKITKSTQSSFVGELQCSGTMQATKISLTVQNRKKTASKIVATLNAGQVTEITSTGTWISAKCP